MKIRNIFKLALAMATLFFIFSCTKEPNAGMPGPRGPQGPPGDENSTPGPQGDPGDDGGSLIGVFASDWIIGDQSLIDYDYGTGFKRLFLSAPEITEDILDEGMVLVYIKEKDENTVHKVEYYKGTPTTGSGVNNQMSQLTITGAIRIYTNMDIEKYSFRYFIFPGMIPFNARTSSSFDKGFTYNDICKYLGVQK